MSKTDWPVNIKMETMHDACNKTIRQKEEQIEKLKAIVKSLRNQRDEAVDKYNLAVWLLPTIRGARD